MSQIVECVPNISEGRDQKKIDEITAAAGAVSGVEVPDVDPGADTNRTVITLAGAPDAILEAAFRLVQKAAELIDMREHSGAHARMGATDVCPFVPVSGTTMEDCAELARKLGARVGEELGIPVYLYEKAASKPERQNLAVVRKGEYEGLEEKLQQPDWEPDFGGRTFNPTAGALLTSARPFLIAYNVNLNTKNKKKANNIALTIREQGRRARDENRKFIKDENGEFVMAPGLFKHCKAVGWYIDEYGVAQISINLTDYSVTNMQHVFDAAEEDARRLGLRVTGSEIVGLVPKEALLDAGRHYMKKQGAFSAVSESLLIHTAIRSLGLSDITPFDPKERIIEERLKAPAPLANMSVTDFADELASDSVAPGGGSVAALAGALGGALTNMVCGLTFSKKKLRDQHPQLLELGERAEKIRMTSLHALDADTAAFNDVIAAMRAVPKDADESSKEYKDATAQVDEAYKEATRVPLGVSQTAVEAIRIGCEVAEIGLASALSDVAVGGVMAKAAMIGGAYNVRINLPEVQDAAFVEQTMTELEALEVEGEKLLAKLLETVNSRMNAS